MVSGINGVRITNVLELLDEIVTTVKKGYRKENTSLLKWAIYMTNKKLKLNRDLDVDVQYGSDYSEIHE